MTFNHDQASAAAKRMHSLHDSHEIAAKARAGLIAKFERLVDPDGTMDPDERLQRAIEERRRWRQEMLAKARASRWARQSTDTV